jgi:hypothetical protein
VARGGSPSGGAGGVGGQGGDASSAGNSGQPPPGSVPIFVALGHVGRTLVSCDDGRTWTLDRDEDPDNRISCKSDDCDHNPFSAKDFSFDAGWFITSLGWGNPSTVRRSRDGFHWETVATSREGADFDNVIGDGKGRFILLDRYDGRVSSDLGEARGNSAWRRDLQYSRGRARRQQSDRVCRRAHDSLDGGLGSQLAPAQYD